MKIPSLTALVLLSLASASVAGEGRLRIPLSQREIPLESWSAVVASRHNGAKFGLECRLVEPTKGKSSTPEGWDCLCVASGSLAKDWMKDLAMVLRVKDREVRGMALWNAPDEPVELPLIARIAVDADRVLLAFGPFVRPGAPEAVAVRLARFDRSCKDSIHIVPRSCMAGEAEIGGRSALVGLLDRDLDGDWSEYCVSAPLGGDAFLIDDDADGMFSFRSRVPTPFMPFMTIAGRTWRACVENEVLTLVPEEAPSMRLRFDGLRGQCRIRGWSDATGFVAADLDSEGSALVPRARFGLHNYLWRRGDWCATSTKMEDGISAVDLEPFGAPPVLLAVDPPAEGDSVSIVAGGTIRCELIVSRKNSGVVFKNRLLDERGLRVFIYRRSGNVPRPTFVVFDAEGKEVFRSSQSSWAGCG